MRYPGSRASSGWGDNVKYSAIKKMIVFFFPFQNLVILLSSPLIERLLNPGWGLLFQNTRPHVDPSVAMVMVCLTYIHSDDSLEKILSWLAR